MDERLQHYLDLWQLTDPQPLAQTHTSDVYNVRLNGTRAVLKLLHPTFAASEEQVGGRALRYFNGHGAVRLLQSDDENGYLLEYAGDEDLVPIVKRGDDDQATIIIAGVLNRLHSVSAGAPADMLPADITTLKRWFAELFRQAELDREQGINSLYVRAAPLAQALLNDPREVRVLHGDIHHENIRLHPERGWLAFDPKGLVGERTYDAANTFCNPMNMVELTENEARILRTADILAEHLEIDRTRLLQFVYCYVSLSAAWWRSDGVHPAHELRIAELIEPHLP